MEDKKTLSDQEKKLEKERIKKEKQLLKNRKKEEAKETKLYTFRNLGKEIKRVVWPKHSKAWKWFGITIAFLAIMALFCFLVSLGFTGLWNVVGIKS
ncbi:preprotein translocase subunit SecE [Mycoplasmopsis arginini]|uniref:preprotein translocase subunit SecE n=1 Tax=Mycoplasmopsis arginini TaxID=2094 RepID=UPI002737273E|nr:preprotein translocase subunit SecE [Mycoplasmopsis arginini]MDP4042659.1 preprotein translocase subunit SecE [Mycoplasmopsis arginini]